ncbi:MAG TPA: hypothetical protein VFZ41_08245 [Solirubrobacterales bacterium]
MTPTNRAIIAVIAIVALGVAFWILALSPKRDEAKKLGTEVEQVETSLAQHRAEVAEALDAREEFTSDYRQLVVLGKAVPGDDDSASLLVQLNQIGHRAGAKFKAITMEPATTLEAAEPSGAGASTTSKPVSPTEAAAATMPLGATIGPAGLGVMPYSLTFDGDFFEIADFIKGIDSLVDARTQQVAVNGRLITVDGFILTEHPDKPFPALESSFLVSTYLTPPSQGVTGGATPSSPPSATATPASTSIGATP